MYSMQFKTRYDKKDTETYYEFLKRIVGDSTMFAGQNENGELVSVCLEENGVFCVRTNQNNNWTRINHYHEDGTVEETYERY